MAPKNFNNDDKAVIHYIFSSLYSHSINNFATFDGRVHNQWSTKELNNAFFQKHYPDYVTLNDQTPVFLVLLLNDIESEDFDYAMLNFISLIKSKKFKTDSILNNQGLIDCCTNYQVPHSLVIADTQRNTSNLAFTQLPSSQTQPISSNSTSDNTSELNLLNRISLLIDEKFKSYAEVTKGCACNTSDLDFVTNDLKELIEKERMFINHLSTNESYKQNKVFPKIYNRFKFPPYLFKNEKEYVDKYKAEILKVKNLWLDFNIDYIKSQKEGHTAKKTILKLPSLVDLMTIILIKSKR